LLSPTKKIKLYDLKKKDNIIQAVSSNLNPANTSPIFTSDWYKDGQPEGLTLTLRINRAMPREIFIQTNLKKC